LHFASEVFRIIIATAETDDAIYLAVLIPNKAKFDELSETVLIPGAAWYFLHSPVRWLLYESGLDDPEGR